VLEALDPDWTEGAQPGLYILFGDHRRPWLTAYSVSAMQEIWRQIDLLPRGTPDRMRLEDFYYGQSTYLSVDDSGRLVLSKELRDRIGLGGEAVFKSSGDTFKIMRPDADAPAQEALTNWLDAQPETFDMASLLPPLPAPGA
jgi:MraZ protein